MELSWDLYETPGDELEAFVRHILLPQRDWKEEVQDAWQRICKFLQHQCFEDDLVLDQEVRVLKVVKVSGGGGEGGLGKSHLHHHGTGGPGLPGLSEPRVSPL